MPMILIVEDEEQVRQLYAKFLEKKGYKVETAENGQKALDFLSDNRPDLILLDMNMPELNGKEFLKIIKADDKLKKIPVFIITGIGNAKEIANAISLGAFGYIYKSNTLAEVLNNIQIVLGSLIATPESNSPRYGWRKSADLDLST